MMCFVPYSLFLLSRLHLIFFRHILFLLTISFLSLTVPFYYYFSHIHMNALTSFPLSHSTADLLLTGILFVCLPRALLHISPSHAWLAELCIHTFFFIRLLCNALFFLLSCVPMPGDLLTDLFFLALLLPFLEFNLESSSSDLDWCRKFDDYDSLLCFYGFSFATC